MKQKSKSIKILLLLIAASACISLYSHNALGLTATFKQQYLGLFTFGTAHEDTPHGVPSSYGWDKRAELYNPQPPDATTAYINFWGQVYVNASNVRPANTRVAVAGCQVWGLNASSNNWQKIIDNAPTSFDSGAWKEDFTADDPSGTRYSAKAEVDGSVSFTNTDGYNAHFFPKYPTGHINVGYTYSEFITACSTRLVLNSLQLPDDRASSTYLLSVGSDWKKADYSCPTNSSGTQVCQSIGVGKFIRVQNNWRRVVMSTLSSADLSSKPLPPDEVLMNPDGTYGSDTPQANMPQASTPSPSNTPTTKVNSPSDNSSSSTPATTQQTKEASPNNAAKSPSATTNTPGTPQNNSVGKSPDTDAKHTSLSKTHDAKWPIAYGAIVLPIVLVLAFYKWGWVTIKNLMKF